jgi:hypothetical protein
MRSKEVKKEDQEGPRAAVRTCWNTFVLVQSEERREKEEIKTDAPPSASRACNARCLARAGISCPRPAVTHAYLQSILT